MGFVVLSTIAGGCSINNSLPTGTVLLKKNKVQVDDKLASDSIIKIIRPTPNKKFFGIPLGVFLYQSINDSTDTSFEDWLITKPNRKKRMTTIWSKKQVDKMKAYKSSYQKWKKRNGEPPVLADSITALLLSLIHI